MVSIMGFCWMRSNGLSLNQAFFDNEFYGVLLGGNWFFMLVPKG